MSARIRMKKISTTSKGRYNFRLVVIDRSSSRDARPIEEIGYYDPSKNPASLKINKARYDYWVSKGAQPSNTVASLYKKYKG
jgi:small subunit ribosomal protein S16